MNRRALFTPAAFKFNLEKSSGFFLSVALFGLGLGSTLAYALDGTTSPSDSAPAIGRVPPQAGMLYSGYLREWLRARQLGDIKIARKFLEDAVCDGDVGAAWELGRMYADGDGVRQDHQLAFEYFSGIADSHADEPTGTGQARFVGSAATTWRSFPIWTSSPMRARGRDMFSHAASYFGDPVAQYRLGRIYLHGQGVANDAKQGVRWLSLAAAAQGAIRTRDGAHGLMWLVLARDAATAEETWMTDQYNAAWE